MGKAMALSSAWPSNVWSRLPQAAASFRSCWEHRCHYKAAGASDDLADSKLLSERVNFAWFGTFSVQAIRALRDCGLHWVMRSNRLPAPISTVLGRKRMTCWAFPTERMSGFTRVPSSKPGFGLLHGSTRGDSYIGHPPVKNMKQLADSRPPQKPTSSQLSISPGFDERILWPFRNR